MRTYRSAIPTNPAATNINESTTSLWNNVNLFYKLGGVAAAIISVVFVLWGLWRRFNNMGRWRLRAVNRPMYVRTWRGWKERDKVKHKAERRSLRKNAIREKLVWRNAGLDYSSMFWDADGVKRRASKVRRDQSIIRYLPQWMRSWKPESIHPNDSNDLEKCRILPPSYYQSPTTQPISIAMASIPHQNSLMPRVLDWGKGGYTQEGFTHEASNLALMSGALPEPLSRQILNTVRRRKAPGMESSAWRAGSEETSRATCTQFLMQKENKPISVAIGARNGETSPAMVPSSLYEWMPQKAFPVPLKDMSTRKKQHAARSVPTDISPNNFSRHIKLYPAQTSEGPYAPQNSEELSPCGHVETAIREISQDTGNSTSFTESAFPSSLSRRLKEWASPATIDPYTSIGKASCGIAGRPSSPAMGWAITGRSSLDVNDHLENYEAEGSFQGSSDASTSPSRNNSHRTRSLLSENSRPSGGSGNTSLSDSGRVGFRKERVLALSDSIFGGCYLPGGLSIGSSLGKPSAGLYSSLRMISNGINVSSDLDWVKVRPSVHSDKVLVPHNMYRDISTKDQKDRPVRLSHAPNYAFPLDALRPRKKRQPLKTNTNLPARKFANLSITSPQIQGRTPTQMPANARKLSIQETAFINNVHQRLDWLDFQLTPGLRGPITNFPYLLILADPCPVTTGRGSPPLVRKLTTSKRSVTMPRNQYRYCEPLIYKEREYADDEPVAGALDTASWLLKRPPGGYSNVGSEEGRMLYTSGRNDAMTLQEWQDVDRTKRTKRALGDAAVPAKSPELKRIKKVVSDGFPTYSSLASPVKKLRRVGKLKIRQRDDGERDNDDRKRFRGFHGQHTSPTATNSNGKESLSRSEQREKPLGTLNTFESTFSLELEGDGNGEKGGKYVGARI